MYFSTCNFLTQISLSFLYIRLKASVLAHCIWGARIIDRLIVQIMFLSILATRPYGGTNVAGQREYIKVKDELY